MDDREKGCLLKKKEKKEQNVSTFEVASGGQNIGKRLIE